MEDACASGLDLCTTLVSTGCNAPGLILDECNENFMNKKELLIEYIVQDILAFIISDTGVKLNTLYWFNSL